MSELLKISLLRLRTLSSDIQGISKHNKHNQIPMSPTLLDSFNIDHASKTAYLSQRTALLAKKNDLTPVDDRLRPYQTQDVNFLLSIKNKANFNQQRVGKTPETLVTMRELNELNNAIIIAPGSTLYSWFKEYKFWTLKDNVIVVSSRMSKAKRAELYKTFKGTIITTYGIVTNDIDLLLARKIDTIVLDEAHRIRNYRSMGSSSTPQVTKSIIQLSRLAKSRYALTGTPAPNTQINIFGILAFLFPTLVKGFWDFVEYYFKTRDRYIGNDDSIKEIGTFLNLQKQREFTEFLEIFSIQRKRKDVMQWIAEVTPTKITLPVSKRIHNKFKELNEYFEISEVGLEAINILDKMTKSRQLAVDPGLLELKDKSVKTEWIKEYLSDYPEKSIIIVSMFTSYLTALQKEIPNSILLIGSTSAENRHKIETDFNNKKTRIILANLDVAKEGMKLYGADTMILVDRSLTYTDNEQVMDRLIPITEQIAQDKAPQEIIIILTDLAIETYIDDSLTLKKSNTDIINNYAAAIAGAAAALKKKGG